MQVCEAAGIRAVMITGDHPLTASTVASELGMLKDRRVVTGRDLEAMSDDDLERDVATSRSTRASRPRTSCASSPPGRAAARSSR